jgi:hypothetical protein
MSPPKVPLFPSTIDTDNVNKAEAAAHVAGKQLTKMLVR